MTQQVRVNDVGESWKAFLDTEEQYGVNGGFEPKHPINPSGSNGSSTYNEMVRVHVQQNGGDTNTLDLLTTQGGQISINDDTRMLATFGGLAAKLAYRINDDNKAIIEATRVQSDMFVNESVVYTMMANFLEAMSGLPVQEQFEYRNRVSELLDREVATAEEYANVPYKTVIQLLSVEFGKVNDARESLGLKDDALGMHREILDRVLGYAERVTQEYADAYDVDYDQGITPRPDKTTLNQNNFSYLLSREVTGIISGVYGYDEQRIKDDFAQAVETSEDAVRKVLITHGEPSYMMYTRTHDDARRRTITLGFEHPLGNLKTEVQLEYHGKLTPTQAQNLMFVGRRTNENLNNIPPISDMREAHTKTTNAAMTHIQEYLN